MKKPIGVLLSAALIVGSLSVVGLNTESTLADTAAPVLTSAAGQTEALYASWDNDENAAEAAVYYKSSSAGLYKAADAPLIRQQGSGGRVDIPGLAAGSYDLRIVTAGGAVFDRKGIEVKAADRSGYAHFNYSEGIGGYSNDGTPKEGAKILYITNENKNTVELEGYTGIAPILKNASSISYPLIVRIIGTVDTQTRDSDGTKSTDIANGVVAINGLADKAMEDDSYFNMLEPTQGSNITVEGIGTDAVVEKWGFCWSNCQSIEVKNLNFTKYPEDACSTNKGSHIWIHNNTFDVGENKYDLTREQDKHEGDGSADIIESTYVTLSYNRFNSCHKTSLHGGGDSVEQYNITWHHNYFNKSSSRMPLVRHANVHSYNNYFYKGSKCIDARASAWVFSEANYFEISTAHLTTANSTEGNPVIKSYMDELISSDQTDRTGTIFTAAAREETYEVSANKESYHNFDTNPSLFYYDSAKNASDVAYLTSAEQAKADCIAYSGVLKAGSAIEGSEGGGEEISTETTTEEPTTEATTSNLIALDGGSYSYNAILEDTQRFKVVDNQNVNGLLKINENGYVEFKLKDRADVTIEYKCGSGSSSKSAACVLNGQTSATVAGDSNDSSVFTVQGLEGGVYRITAVVNGTTTAQIISVKVVYSTETSTEATTESATEASTEASTETTTHSEDPTVLYGDADASASLTANDAAYILAKALNGSFETPVERLNPYYALHLDVNGSGDIDAEDAAQVLTKVLDSEYEFPCMKNNR